MTIIEGIAPTPRYRYREEPPSAIEVPLAELLSRLPRAFVTDRDPGTASVSLPCGELFSGSIPRLPAGRLHELAPDHVRLPEGEDPSALVPLDAGWLALRYRPVTVREAVAPDPVAVPAEPVAKTGKPSVEKSAENQAEKTNDDLPVTQAPATAPEPVAKEVSKPSPESSSKALSPADDVPVSEMPAVPAVPPHARRRLLDSLPIFRRHRPEPAVTTLPPAPPAPELFPELAPVTMTAAPGAVAALPEMATLPPEALASQAALQALFMTEETLTVQGVVSRAATLPGLRACVLARGDMVLCTSDSPAGSELRTLSGQAMTLLTGIRASSVGMGLGTVPAVTLHADGGALSILQEGDLCLLVMHSGRGFLPGVRERLQELIHHLPGTLALPPVSGRD